MTSLAREEVHVFLACWLVGRVRLVLTASQASVVLWDANFASSSFSLSTIFVHVVRG